MPIHPGVVVLGGVDVGAIPLNTYVAEYVLVPAYDRSRENALSDESGPGTLPGSDENESPTGYDSVVVEVVGAIVPVNEMVIGEEDVYVPAMVGHAKKRLPIVVVAAGSPPVIGLVMVSGINPGPFVWK